MNGILYCAQVNLKVTYRDSNSACAPGGWYHKLITHHLRHSKREVPHQLLILTDETRLGTVHVTASIVIWRTGGSKITFLEVVCLWVTLLCSVHLCVYCWVLEKAQVEIRSSLCGIVAEACFLGQSRAVALLFVLPDVLTGPRAGSASDGTTVRTRRCLSCITGPTAKTECKISFSPTAMFWSCILKVLCSNTGQGSCRRAWKVWCYLALAETFVSGCYLSEFRYGVAFTSADIDMCVCVTQTGTAGHWQFSDDVATCCFSYQKVWVGTVDLVVLLWYSYFAIITSLVFFS